MSRRDRDPDDGDDHVMPMNNLKAALAASMLPGSTSLTERHLLIDLIRQRIEHAIDVDALLVLEADLRDAVAVAEREGGAVLDVAFLVDEGWRRMEESWRELRKIDITIGGECPLCPIPESAEHIDIDLTATCGTTGHARMRRRGT